MSVDWNKALQTRDGLNARLVGVTAPTTNGYTHVVEVVQPDGFSKIYQRYESGHSTPYSALSSDIINVPERTERFINIYAESGVAHFVHPTLEEAKRKAELTTKTPPIGHLKITLENGKAVKAEIV